MGEVALQRPQSEDAYRNAVGSMLEEVDRLTRLLDNLLTLSRADAAEHALEREPCDLLHLVEEVACDMAVLAEERGQRIEVSGDARTVRVDREVLRLAVVNLLDNAIKHSPEGGLIEATVSGAAERTTIAVHDHGPGVPIEHREHIFERFYRADEARSRSTGGSGLGLSIATWAVEAHGGSLVLADRDGTPGATFHIHLPWTEGLRS